jgi:hypothetical protein
MAGSRDFKYLYEWCEATPASEDLANVVLARVTHQPLPNPPRTYAGQLRHVVGSLPEEHGFSGLLPDTQGVAASRLSVEMSLEQHVNNAKVNIFFPDGTLTSAEHELGEVDEPAGPVLTVRAESFTFMLARTVAWDI